MQWQRLLYLESGAGRSSYRRELLPSRHYFGILVQGLLRGDVRLDAWSHSVLLT